ncbi:MAG: DUF4921 family protein [Candidatus Jordarchaeales archaeon]|nr:DUF4921 family protein [Candidatus Jordarchaeia archaeon]
MTELRRDYLAERWVVIARERAMRPSDLKVEGIHQSPSSICPFCPGNEHMTLPATLLYLERDGELVVKAESDSERLKGWLVRVIPNMYPALRPNVNPARHCEGFMVRVGGMGAHEVIIETPEHDTQFCDLSDRQLFLVFKAYTERFKALASLPHVKYVSLFRNYGKEAGASLSHPHSQIIATPIIPPRISEETASFKERWNGSSCILDEVLEQEASSERFVDENEFAVAFCPYAPIAPFEVWVVPKRHIKNILELSEKEMLSFARLTRKVLKAIHIILNDPPYNYTFHQSILDEEYHMHLRVLPRLSIFAGFEFNTGIVINTIPPEEAASQIGGVMKEI